MITEQAFKPYEGDEPYIFVSYSHKDSEQVFPILQKLYERGLRIWYDEGIDPGSEWPEEIANHLLNCGLFLLFMSPDAAESHNVRREITMAIDRKKPLINIFIKETQLKPGLQLQLNLIQHISYAHGKESFDEFTDRLADIILKNENIDAAVAGLAAGGETELLKADFSGVSSGGLRVILRDINDPKQIWNLSLTNQVEIGRSAACPVCVTDGSVSRLQCKLYLENNQPMLENISKANITRLNGEQITQPRPIKQGDKIKCGRVIFVIDKLC